MRCAFTYLNGPVRTGMDLKIRPKIHVLCILDKKFWLSKVKYQISLANMHIYIGPICMGYLCGVTQMGLKEPRLKNDINIFV